MDISLKISLEYFLLCVNHSESTTEINDCLFVLECKPTPYHPLNLFCAAQAVQHVLFGSQNGLTFIQLLLIQVSLTFPEEKWKELLR